MGENIVLKWDNDDAFVLQETKPLQASPVWSAWPATPQLVEGKLSVILPLTNNNLQFFRLKERCVEFTHDQETVCWRDGGTFNAHALLSPESVQNSFNLNWTISSNAVGATISPGGVVGLGTGVGSFTILASTTNGACSDSFTIKTIRAQFTNATSVISWQSNATFDVSALLAVDGITSPSLVDWSITGTPTATINTSGVVTLGSGGGSYTIRATINGTTCSDVFTLIAVESRLVSITFVDAGAGHGGNNQHVLYENAAPQDWGEGAPIANPAWIASGSRWDAPPLRSVPVCYTRSDTIESKARIQAVVNIKPSGQTLNFIGLDQSTEYFRADGILSTEGNQIIDMVAKVPLPATIEKLTKIFTWQAVFPNGGAELVQNAGLSTQTIYTVYAPPITYIEGQTNNPTPKRLDFCIIGVANGLSNKVAICNEISTKVRGMTGNSFGEVVGNPRWAAYAEPPPRDLDCHHRAALAANGFGVIGIQGYVYRAFATSNPVPTGPQFYPANSTLNDYIGTYTGSSKIKYAQPGADIHKLRFLGNNFEGCVRIDDGSADDGSMWWTIWPLGQHENARTLMVNYTAICPQRWEKLDTTFIANETVPVGQMADKPKLLGGPN